MKILLTHAYYLHEDPRELQIMKPYSPLGILYISAFLEKNGFANEVIDSTFSSFEEHQAEILKLKPDVIGIYTNLMTKLNVLRLIDFIKNNPSLQHTKVVLGGPEVRNHLDNFLKHGADYVVTGEGETTMLELVQAIQTGDANQKPIAGVSRIEDGVVISGPNRENIRDIDALSMPARQKINLKKYFDAWKSRHGESAASVSTMRGCPYTCKWCSRAVYGQSYRRRSPALVVDELEWIKNNYDVDTIWFVDDVFTVSHKWMEAFTTEIKNRKLKIKYECITRADRMNVEMIQLLKESGCYRVWIGAESGSQRIIDAMDRRVDVNQVREMIRKSREYGLQAGTFIMVGYPGETDDDLKETLHHLISSGPDQFTITVAYPIKGTPLYQETQPFFTSQPDWETSTDRQIDFKRTYARGYYDYAVRWITNEVNYNKSTNSFRQKYTFKAKSIAARSMMFIERLRSTN